MPPADMNAPEYPETFPELLKWHRVSSGLSQTAIGHLTGLHGRYWCRLERGERSASPLMIMRIADALVLTNAQLEELLRAAGHQTPALSERVAALVQVDTTYRALWHVLESKRLSESSKANLRACIEVMCATWLATVPSRVAAERKEA